MFNTSILYKILCPDIVFKGANLSHRKRLFNLNALKILIWPQIEFYYILYAMLYVTIDCLCHFRRGDALCPPSKSHGSRDTFGSSATRRFLDRFCFWISFCLRHLLKHRLNQYVFAPPFKIVFPRVTSYVIQLKPITHCTACLSFL